MPMEVGPLARAIVNYAAKDEMTVNSIDRAVRTLSQLTNKFNGKDMGINIDSMYSTAGRILARAVEATDIADYMADFYNELITNIRNGDERMFNGTYWEPDTWPRECKGYSLSEAPRGALAHYSHIRDKKIVNYQMVVPTTWNASPRDTKGQHSAFEASVIGTPVAGLDPEGGEMALSIIRTLHSFDPCMACAVHLYDENGSQIHKIEINNR